MNVRKTGISGLLVLEPKIFGDDRGYFLESYSKRRYAEIGIHQDLVQDNMSFSRRGVLRGLHFQNPSAQGKLVYVLQGAVFDVAVDLRRSSPTFGKWHGLTLSGENKWQFWVPPGFAHGFCVTSETALFAYKCSAYYAPEHECAIRYDDPDIGIEWPISDPTLSAKDRSAKRLSQMDISVLFD